MAAHQAPVPGILQARTLEWVPCPFPVHESEKWKWSRSVVSDSSRPHGLQPTRLLHPWDFPGKSTGEGCHCLLRYCYLVNTENNAMRYVLLFTHIYEYNWDLKRLICQSQMIGMAEHQNQAVSLLPTFSNSTKVITLTSVNLTRLRTALTSFSLCENVFGWHKSHNQREILNIL